VSSVSVHRRCVSIVSITVAATAAMASYVPAGALASLRHTRARVAIVRPSGHVVSGTTEFSARGVALDARRIVFTIDGRRVWTIVRPSRRFLRTAYVNTRRLRNGRHVLRLRVLYASRPAAEVRKTILVENQGPVHRPIHARSGPPSSAGPSATTPAQSSAGPLDVGAFGPPIGGVPGESVANFNRETYLYSTTWSLSDEASRYQVMVLPGNDYALVPQLKAINPSLKILLYQSIFQTNRDDYSYMQTVTGCTAYADDIANHPDWFLHDQSGNIVLSVDTSDHYLMDVGNPGYQQACASNAAALAKKYGFDGIFFDVVTGQLLWSMSAGLSVPEYPTQASWVAAMNSALSYLGPALRSQGLLAFGNVSATPDIGTWEQWVSHLDGVEEESWTDGGLGLAQQVPYWSQKFAELAWAQANGKYEIVHSYNGGEAANTFGLAAMLLVANGGASYSTSNTDYTSNENWFPEYTTAAGLGAPAGPYKVLANGVYERAFSNGIVLVNPGEESIPPFSLGGGTYTGSGLNNVDAVQMGPTSGLVLLKAS
jgi:Hypothetical glycosyl hydrolase family 15